MIHHFILWYEVEIFIRYSFKNWWWLVTLLTEPHNWHVTCRPKTDFRCCWQKIIIWHKSSSFVKERYIRKFQGDNISLTWEIEIFQNTKQLVKKTWPCFKMSYLRMSRSNTGKRFWSKSVGNFLTCGKQLSQYITNKKQWLSPLLQTLALHGLPPQHFYKKILIPPFMIIQKSICYL